MTGWWWRDVVTMGSGDDEKWWRWEVVRKGSGEYGKWWGREVVTMGSGEEGKWWKKGSDDEGEWWGREVVRKGSGDEGKWWVGEKAGARNLVFFRVKWLQPAMKGTSSVRRLRLRSFLSRIVPPMCFATSGCSCVRSSMRFLKLWWQIALEWLHDVAWALCWGESRSTKPCVFPCKVAAAGDERYLVCAAVAAAVVSVANCSSYVFCNEWLFLCV